MFFFTHMSIGKRLYKEFFSDEGHPIDKASFIYGNIKPDLPFAGFSGRHTLSGSYSFIKEKLEKVTSEDLTVRTRSVMLGEICHFASDYFCAYHADETIYDRPLRHFFYELMQFLSYIRSKKRFEDLNKQFEPEDTGEWLGEIISHRKEHLTQKRNKLSDMEKAFVFTASLCNIFCNTQSKKTLVSVVVPVYKAEKYLARCLDSIIAQYHRPLEVILINDGSPDGSGVVISSYEKKWDFIKSVHQENQGVSTARNNGLSIASGDYIVFIDADDYVKPDYISRMLDKAIRSNADVVMCGFSIFHSKLPLRIKVPLLFPRNTLSGPEAARRSLGLKKYPVFVWSKLYKRDLFINEKMSFPDIYYEDIAFVPRILYSAGRVAFTSRSLYHYRLNPAGITGDFKEKNISDYITSLMYVKQFLEERSLGKDWSKTYDKILRTAFTHMFLEIIFKAIPRRKGNKMFFLLMAESGRVLSGRSVKTLDTEKQFKSLYKNSVYP